MRSCAILLALLSLFTPIVTAQTPAPAQPLQFEVATIKPIDPTPGVMHMGGVKVYPGGRITIGTASLKNLIFTAFDISSIGSSREAIAWTEKQRVRPGSQAWPKPLQPPPTTCVTQTVASSQTCACARCSRLY